MSGPATHSWMTKDLLLRYTFFALCALAAVSVLSWGFTPVVLCAVSVLVALAVDYLLSTFMKGKTPSERISAAVFGMMVALSYSLGIPQDLFQEAAPLTAPAAYLYVAIISAVGMILLEKLQGLLKRKYVNSVASAKLLVFLPSLYQVLIPAAHQMLNFPSLTSPIGFDGSLSFASYLQACFANTSLANTNAQNVLYTLIVLKYHGWVGGASSLAVIIVGVVFFLVCRQYVKWRITATYLVTVALFAYVLSFVYGGDPLLRVSFHLFIGSSIFLAFFMATEQTTTPLTHLGQAIFGVGLGILTLVIQVYMGFLGGSILALVIMNFTSPFLDNFGRLRPQAESAKLKLPREKELDCAKTRIYDCMRCGACMRYCCHRLSPILIKQAYDKGDLKAARNLKANLCDGCGNCNFVCPSRVDLKAATLRAEAALRKRL